MALDRAVGVVGDPDLVMMRTDHCGNLTLADVGREVALCGWVHSRRDHGGVTFIDLRDTSGLVQVVFAAEIDRETHDAAQDLRGEFCVRVEGEVRPRPEGTRNPKLPTGDVEVAAANLQILSESETPPFQVDESHPHHRFCSVACRVTANRKGIVTPRKHNLLTDS